MEDKLGEFAGLSPWKQEGEVVPEPSDGDQMGSQPGSPRAAIRHVLSSPQYFCFVFPQMARFHILKPSLPGEARP